MSNRLLTQIIDELDPAKLREAIKALPPWKSERTGKSRRVPVVNIKPMLTVIADKTNDEAPQKGMWYSQPHIALMTGYSVSQIQQCQYIAQALGVLKVVPRSNKTIAPPALPSARSASSRCTSKKPRNFSRKVSTVSQTSCVLGERLSQDAQLHGA